MKEEKIFLSWKLFCALHYRGFKIIYWFIAIYIDHRYYLFFTHLTSNKFVTYLVLWITDELPEAAEKS